MKRILVIENYRFGKNYLRKAKELGYETILATYHKKDEVAEEDRPFIDHHVQIQIENFDATVNRIVEYYKEMPFDGVLAGHVFLMPQAAAVTDRLGLPSFGYQAACNANYKDLTRKLIKDAGLFPFYYYEVSSMEDLENIKDKIAYPCIIKPIDGFASINVFKPYSFDELKKCYQEHLNNINYGALGKSFSPKMLVEEYLTGREYSVESVAEDGEVTVLTITEKVLDEKYQQAEIGHLIPASNLQPGEKDRITNYVKAVHKALGVKTGVTHTEVKIDGGKLGLMELNPRVGGGYIPDILGKVISEDMYGVVVRNCIGEKLGKQPEIRGNAYVRFMLAPNTGKLKEIKGIEAVSNMPGILFVENRYKLGSDIHVLNDNRARVFAIAGYNASDLNELKQTLANAESKIDIIIE